MDARGLDCASAGGSFSLIKHYVPTLASPDSGTRTLRLAASGGRDRRNLDDRRLEFGTSPGDSTTGDRRTRRRARNVARAVVVCHRTDDLRVVLPARSIITLTDALSTVPRLMSPLTVLPASSSIAHFPLVFFSLFLTLLAFSRIVESVRWDMATCFRGHRPNHS